MASKDFYNLLGVKGDAAQEEIKQAFRKLAHQFHPDKTNGDAEKFKEINEAYQVLSDPEKRKRYDQSGSAAFENGGQGFGGFSAKGGPASGWDFSGFQNGGGFEDLGDLFGDLFGFSGGRGRQARRHGQDVRVDIDVGFSDAVFGTEREVTLTKTNVCARCAGMGAEPGTRMKKCDTCGGSGMRVSTQRTILGVVQTKTACPTCEGRGEVPETPCKTCQSEGVEKSRKTLTITIPSGIEDGSMLRLRGEGEAIKGGPAGDMYVRIHVEADPRFSREGSFIRSKKRIGFTQAALGDTIEVETVDGLVDLKIQAGTQTGTEFRLRGKGVPLRSGRGDHIVTVEVATPKKLSREQKKKFEELDLREE